MEELIELQTVTVQAQEHISLDSVSVVLPGNRSTVIMGPSGSGKSMLLKVAAQTKSTFSFLTAAIWKL